MNIRLALVTLILPAIMEVSGLVMMLHPPKERNAFFGYRTRRSLLSKETWDFANYYCGTLYVYLGFYVATVTLLTDIIVRITQMGKTGTAAVIIAVVLIQSFCFIFPIFFVEAKLKANFDDQGNLTNPAMDVRLSAAYDDSDWNDWKNDDWKNDEWKEAWRDEYSDWELWKKMKDEEIAAKKREAEAAKREAVKGSASGDMVPAFEKYDQMASASGKRDERMVSEFKKNGGMVSALEKDGESVSASEKNGKTVSAPGKDR